MKKILDFSPFMHYTILISNIGGEMRLGFVLSSGGPAGVAHLGVLKRLEEGGIKPDVLAGSSAGSIIGGLYASGISVDEMIDLSLGKTITQMFSDYSILGMRKNGFGAIKGEKLLNILREKTGNKQFKDLKIPTGFNAVNAHTSKEVLLKKGGVAEAMRASSSIPILFKPYLFNGKYLIDGAVSNPLPSKIAKNLGADKVIGITFKRNPSKRANMKGDFSLKELKNLALTKLDSGVLNFVKNVVNFPFFDKLMNFLAYDKDMIKHYFKMHNEAIDEKGAKHSDILIQPDLGTLSGGNLEDIIKAGYKHTDDNINNITKQIEDFRSNHGVVK